MAGVNKVILVGNLGADPEIKQVNSTQAANVSLATSESWTDKTTNQRQEKTEWHRLVFWDKLADIAAQYLKKGSQIYVEGKLQTRSWDDHEPAPGENRMAPVGFLGQAGRHRRPISQKRQPDLCGGQITDAQLGRSQRSKKMDDGDPRFPNADARQT